MTQSSVPAPMEQYAASLRILHWLIAVLVITLICVGLYMAGLPKDAPNRMTLYALHKSVGILVFGLLWIRILVRFTTYIPPLPAHLARWEVSASHMVHLAFYLLLFLMPATGYMMTAGSGFDVLFFGIKLPTLMAPNKPLAHTAHDLHEYLGYTLAALIGLHILGALKHQYYDRYPIFRRMWR